MKARHLIICVIIVGGIALFLRLRPAAKPTGVAPQAAQEMKAGAETYSASGINGAGLRVKVDGALASAFEMAAFIDQVYVSVPTNRFATRDHLKEIQAVFFVSDYVMAAKTNRRLTLSEPAIVAAFTNVAQDTSYISDRLRFWAARPSTLTDHYKSISEIPSDQENIKSIKAALTGNGLVIDTESDLLMDCIRYVVHNTSIYEMYGANPRRIEQASAFPPELNALVSTGDTIFQHRFAEKFKLNQDTIVSLMNQLKQIRLYNLSAADVEIPVIRF